MIIICPHCQTRYQVAAQTISAAGRHVQCAHCHKSWHATRQEAEAEIQAAASGARAHPAAPQPAGAPGESDSLFNAAFEQELDKQFEAEEQASTSQARPRTLEKVDLALVRKRRNALLRRQRELTRKMPAASLRRAVRIASVALLVAVVAGGIRLRTPIVTVFPALAGLYAGIGLPVNVVGLQIEEAKTLRTSRDGRDVLQIDAKIVNVAGRNVGVPAVRVNLLDATGRSVYAWRVRTAQKMMAPGETMTFATELVSPPKEAARARLEFVADGNAPKASAGASASLAPGE